MKRSHIAWILVGLAAMSCTPLAAIPMIIYGVFFYPSQFARNTDAGRPIVQAVYRYRSAIGLYPEKLDDLVPAYLADVPKDWGYYPPSGGRPPKLRLHGAFHSFLTYHFAVSGPTRPADLEPEGWEYSQEGTLHFQGKDRVPAPPLDIAKDELTAARLEELRRRVEIAPRDVGLADAYTRLISELVRLGRLDEAGDACRDCIGELDGRWCRMALADLDLRRGSTAGPDGLVAWARKSPSFSRYYAVSLIHRMHGRTAEALAAIRDAARYPLNPSDADLFIPEYLGFDSALFAYRNGQHDLALAICEDWERCVRAQGHGERSYHAVRAATYLAMGRRADATPEVARALQVDREGKTWAGDLPALLERAIQADDRHYVYGPGGDQSHYQIFLDEIE